MGRHVMIEVGEGIISWMNPSGPHEDIGHASDKVVELAGDVLSILVKAKRGTRWKGPEDSKKTGLEADAAFYIGDNAERWFKARKKD
ncbi:MAG: hypothetical protein OXC57_08165 [Rhodobacteraceae bacterium]|nr:hypothetical protein [Paracoccaceae bacterium]